jgi:hypothetical protein
MFFICAVAGQLTPSPLAPLPLLLLLPAAGLLPLLFTSKDTLRSKPAPKSALPRTEAARVLPAPVGPQIATLCIPCCTA